MASSSAFRSPSTSRRVEVPEPDSAPAGPSPDELGFERIVYHEGGSEERQIRLNRPEVLNAFDFRMLRELARACEDA